MFVSMEELLRFIDWSYVERSIEYVHCVENLQISWDGLQYLARVPGSARQPYQVLVKLRGDALGLDKISGQCSCPVHYNCKHVAATILAANKEQEQPMDEAQALDERVRDWLRRIRRRDEVRATPAHDEQLCYVLDLRDAGGLHIDVIRARHLQSGGLGKGVPFNAGAASTANVVVDADRPLLTLIEHHALARRLREGGYDLPPGTDAGTLMELLLHSGRCYWRDHRNTPALSPGDPRQGSLEWRQDADGLYRVHLKGGDDALLLPLAAPWYIDPDTLHCGRLELDMDEQAVRALLDAPPLTPEQAFQVHEVAGTLPEIDKLPLPDIQELDIREDAACVPCLRLGSEPAASYWEEESWEHSLSIRFLYDGFEISPLDKRKLLPLEGGGLLRRQLDDEVSVLTELEALGFMSDPLNGVESLIHPDGEPAWLDFVTRQIPRLEQQGWRFEFDPSFQLQILDVDAWYVDLDEGGGGDWFDLELGVEIEGRRISLLPVLVDFIADQRRARTLNETLEDDKPLLLNIGDGYVELPMERVRHIVGTLAELYDPDALDDDRLRLSRFQANTLNELAEADMQWGGAKAPRRFAEKLAGFSGIAEVVPPSGLQAELRPYQQQGLNWLQFLREYDFGGILADDMGLGKTIQTLAHLLAEREAGRADRPSLVVAPTSLMVNWRREARRFAPDLKVLVLHGPQRKQYFDSFADYDLVLTTYPLLPRDAEALKAQPWHLLVLDEAQNIKNPRAKAAVTARELEARHRLCLTGTPLENHLGELWSQFHFLMPGLLGDEKRFRRLFRTPIEKQGDEQRQQQLRKRIAPFLLRREKAEVVKELPEKTEILSEVELQGAQRELYETIRIAMHEKVRRAIDKKGIQRSQIIILDALLKLRQVCCDPRLLKLDAAKKVRQSAKLDQLMTMLPEMIEEGRRVLLFSQFTSMLTLIEAELKKHKIAFVKLTGQTRDRETPVDRFQNGEVPLFLISLKAGGSGLNLTAADTVIHYDPWWNPAVERQATDRAHRIGQKKAVFVYRFVTRGTVEEKITALQQHKQGLADALFGKSGKQATQLGEEDLKTLFEPLE